MKTNKKNYRMDWNRLIDNSIQNFTKGMPERNRQHSKHVPRQWGTQHYWVQTQKVDIGGVRGTAIIDAFDYFGQAFDRLTSKEIESAVLNGSALIASTQRNVNSPLLTNSVFDQVSLERLRFDLHQKFDLCICLSFGKDGYITRKEVLPMCRTNQFIEYGIEREWNSLFHIVGNQAGLYRARRAGVRLDDTRRTKMFGVFTQEDAKGVSQASVSLINEFIQDSFLSGYRWGVKPAEDIKYENEILQIINNETSV